MSLRRIGKAYATSSLNVVSGLLSNLVLLRVVVDEVPKEDFGLYMLVFQATAFIGFAQIGLDLAAVRQIAEHLATGETRKAAGVYRTLARFNWTAALLIVVVTGLVFCFLNSSALISNLIVLVGATQALQFISRPASAVLMAGHRLSDVNLIGVLRSISTTVIAFTLIRGTGLGVTAIPLAEFFSTLVAWLILERQRQTWFDWAVVRGPAASLLPLLRFGMIAGLGGLGWTVEAASDVYLLNWLSNDGTKAVADFSLWTRMPHLAFLLATQFTFSAFPTMAAFQSLKLADRRKFFEQLVWIMAGLAGLLALGLTAWLPPFIHHWLAGAADRADGPAIAGTVAAMVAIRLFGSLFGSYWLATGRAGLSSIICWGQATIKIVVSVILFQFYGMTGLLAGSILAGLLSTAVYIVAFRAAQVSGGLIVLPILSSIIAGSLVGILLQPFVMEVTLSELCLGIVLTLITWSAVWATLLYCLRSFCPSQTSFLVLHEA